jgi:hypothetical protein
MLFRTLLGGVFLSLVPVLGAAGPPTLSGIVPPPGTVSELREITVTFSAPVTGIHFSDLLLNGMPAYDLSGSDAVWTFAVEQPAYGAVQVTWDPGQAISDLETPPNRFDGTGPGAAWQYTLVDTLPPVVTALTPAPDVTVRQLSQVEVQFSELVTGVDAADLLVNGAPAASLQVLSGGRYLFLFTAPTNATVQLAWAANHGIRDFSGNAFAGGSWSCQVDADFGLPQVRINEFVAANISGLKDENGEFVDWIELYNYGANTVNLAGWSLSDDREDPGRWIFSATNLAARKFLLVFASGKDRRTGTNLHTNFKLNANGSYLGLYNGESPRVAVSEFAPEFPEQRNNYSYGLDAAGNWKYFKTPTPRTNNGVSTITGIAPPPHFNVERGLFESPFQLILNADLPGATIRYTIDGSEPTDTNGLAYTGPVTIAKTTVFRAATFAANLLPSVAVTHTYVFLDQVLRQPNNPPGFPAGPTVFTGYPSDYEMDPEIVTNAVYGPQMKAALKALPMVSIVMKTDDLFGANNGIYTHPEASPREAWERPCSVEFVLTNGQTGFQVNCGIRIQGNASRTPVKTPKHPFRLFFKGDYGPGQLNYPIYPDSPVASFNGIVLRADFNNSWIHWDGTQRIHGSKIRDAWVKETFREMGQASGHARHFHLYINGLYWGVYDFGERIDADFGARYYGGTPEEYDAMASKPTEAIDGTMVAYSKMLSMITGRDMRVLTNYVNAQKYLDMTNFIDYTLLNFYGANADWGVDGNWNAVCRRVAGATYKYLPWDCEQLIVNTTDNRVGSTDMPSGLHPVLLNSLEYRLAFADRAHKHLFNGGALSTNAVIQRWLKWAAQLDPAIIAESARWGDYRRDVAQYSGGPYYLYTRNDYWVPENNRITTNYFPLRAGIFLQQLRDGNLYPKLTAPSFSQHGGRVPHGFSLTITATNKVYYTTNGEDPRVYGTGAISTQALLYATPVIVGDSMWVKARLLNSTNWSALNEAYFTVDMLGAPLRITELMYNPVGGDAYEFIELRNIGNTTLNIGNYSLEGVTYTFPPQTYLAPGQILVLGSDTSPGNWNARYPGVTAFGRFDGHLANSGEKLTVLDANRNVVCAVDYSNKGGWPKAADGLGCSLEIIDPWGDPDAPANWRASAAADGTPGAPAAPPALGSVVLNEVMAENTAAVANGATHPDWIELRNTADQPADISGWSFTDDDNPRKFVFPAATVIPAGGFLVVWCDGITNTTPGLHAGFALSRYGETIFLYNAQSNQVDALSYGPQTADLSVGRVEGTWQLTLPTPNAANQAAPIAASTNLVLNEWLANAAPGTEDWIELYNRTTNAPVSLQGVYLGTNAVPFQINSLSFVPPGGYVQLFADAKPGPDHLEFKLPASGGTLLLFSEAGGQIDQVTYGPQAQDVSQGRLPDGATNLVSFPGSASPCASNYVVAYSGAILNEVMARNSTAVTNALGQTADWVELFNPTATPFELSGMRLSNDETDPNQWLFPANTVLAARSYLVVWFDEHTPASTAFGPALNTGQALGGQGGAVVLFNRAGQPVDALEYGVQINDLSLGRDGGGQWQLLARPTPGAANASPAALGPAAGLRINEWMADPLGGNDWFELYNPGSQPAPLDGLYVSDNPSIVGLTQFALPPRSFIGAGGFARFLADGQPGQGFNHVNFNIDALGEALRLYRPDLGVIDTVYFGAQPPGASQGRLPDGGDQIVSFAHTASPGESNFLPLEDAVISEVLTHAEPPLEPAIEVLNPSGSPVNIGGWCLSDTLANLKRFRIPDGTVLEAGGCAVFYAGQFDAGGPGSFTLDAARGGQVFLSEVDAAGNLTGKRAVASFGASGNGVSIGRYNTSVDADFVPLSQRTFGVDAPASLAQFRAGTGAPNAYPAVGPVVINEIMYHPPDLSTNDNTLDEYLELFNKSGAAVELFDPSLPANTWRLDNGVRFQFPTNVSLPADGYLLVVNFDPATNLTQTAAFRAKFSVPEAVPLMGPYEGKLDNGGETLELYRPDIQATPPFLDADHAPYLLVDRVAYGDIAPWPVSGDGDGNSLQRLAASDYGNEPLNWLAAAPTAGRANAAGGAVKPMIVVQPVDGFGLTNGAVTFSVAAVGTRPLTYHWRLNGTLLAQGTNPVLRVAGLLASQSGDYSVVVSNGAGVAVSDTAHLYVMVPPMILAQPQSQTLYSGDTAALSVSASSVGAVQYQWRLDGTDLPGATNASLAFAPADVADSGTYTVRVFNPVAGVVSEPAVLRVLRKIEITSQPRTSTNSPGTTATFSVGAVGTGTLFYQWRFKGPQDAAATDLAGATNAALTLTGVGLEDGGEYSVQVTDDLGTLVSQPAKLVVMMAPTISQQPQGLTVAVGSNASFSVTAQGTWPLAFRWRKSVGGSYVYLATNVLSTSNCTFTLPNVRTNDGTAYSVLITNIAKIAGQPSLNAYLTVVVPPTNLVVAPGDTAVFSALAYSRAFVTYQWLKNGLTLPGETGTTLTRSNVQPGDAGTYGVLVNTLTNTPVTPATFSATLDVLRPDRDGDGLPDDWELAHSLNPADANDAALDSDRDGLTNLQEYLAGTDPQNSQSVLKLNALSAEPGGTNVLVRFSFGAVTNHTYSVLFFDGPAAGAWERLLDVDADAPTNRLIQVTNTVPAITPQRYFRVVTPKR